MSLAEKVLLRQSQRENEICYESRLAVTTAPDQRAIVASVDQPFHQRVFSGQRLLKKIFEGAHSL